MPFDFEEEFRKQIKADAAISRGRCAEHEDCGGAPPSNTAPSNCMEGEFKILRNGVDSLYLSFKGELHQETFRRLEALKEAAQTEGKEHLAQVQLEGHIFTVSDKGRKGFDYVIHDNCFEIALSSTAARRPVGYVKVASSYLAANTLQQTYNKLYTVMNALCYLEDTGTVSRADLFMDFCADVGFVALLTPENFVRTAHIMRPYYDGKGEMTGIDFGLGGDLSCRLYNKTRQIKDVGGQEYLPLLWSKAGWDGIEDVWRLEFQLRRNPLSQFSIIRVQDLQERLESLWEYLTKDWLRLVIPNQSDKTRSRWITHPIWKLISEGFAAEGEQVFLKRVKKDSAPDEANIIRAIASNIISWMAIRNITDVKEGLTVLCLELPKLLKLHQTLKGVPLVEHIKREVPKRIRQFNLRRNDDDLYSISNFDSLRGE